MTIDCGTFSSGGLKEVASASYQPQQPTFLDQLQSNKLMIASLRSGHLCITV